MIPFNFFFQASPPLINQATLSLISQSSSTSLDVFVNNPVIPYNPVLGFCPPQFFLFKSQPFFQSTLSLISQNSSASLNSFVIVPLNTVLPSTIEKVFNPFVQSIINGIPSVFNSTNCIVSTRDEIPDFPGSPFCWLCPGDFSEIELQVTGSGRAVSAVDGSFVLKLRVRNLQDVAYQDTQFYINPASTLGLYTLVDSIVNVLHLNFVTDSIGNSICEEPPILMDIEQANRVDTGREYGGLDLTFYVSLYMDIPFLVP